MAYRYLSVHVIVRQLEALLEFFGQEAGVNNDAERIYGNLRHGPTLLALHALRDILYPVHRMSLSMQERGLSVYKALEAKTSCVQSLELMKGEGEGPLNLPSLPVFLAKCHAVEGRRPVRFKLGDHELTNFRRGGAAQLTEDLTACGVVSFFERLLQSLQERFTADCDVVMRQFSIIDPASWGGGGFNVGLHEMGAIGDHYRAEMVEGQGLEIDKEALLIEWSCFKTTPEWKAAISAGPKPAYCNDQEAFWGHFFLKGSGSAEAIRDAPEGRAYKQLFKVVVAAIVMIIGNAEAERAFSCMNRVCSDFRSRLTSEHLEALMLISFATKMARQGEFPQFSRQAFDWDVVWRRFLMKDRRPGDLLPTKRAEADAPTSKRDRVRPRRKRARAPQEQEPGQAKTSSEVKTDYDGDSDGESIQSEQGGTDQPLEEVLDFGNIRDTIQFQHSKLSTDERTASVNRTFVDDGEMWRILEVGWGLRTKKAYVIYVKDAELRKMFPDCNPTFTEVYKRLEEEERAQDSDSDGGEDDEATSELNRRVLDYFDYTPMKEAQRHRWVPTLAQIERSKSRVESLA
jgi:hypothetical protein